MVTFCFSGKVFSTIGRIVSSGTNLLAPQVVKQMERISELLPEEDVQNSCMGEIVRRSVETYIRKLAGRCPKV